MSTSSGHKRRRKRFIYIGIGHAFLLISLIFLVVPPMEVMYGFSISSVVILGITCNVIAVRTPAETVQERVIAILYYPWVLAALWLVSSEFENISVLGMTLVILFPYLILIYRDFVIGYELDVKDEIRRLKDLGVLSESEAEEKRKVVLKKEAIKKAEESVKNSEEYYSLLRLKNSGVLTETEFNQKVEELKNRKVEMLMRGRDTGT